MAELKKISTVLAFTVGLALISVPFSGFFNEALAKGKHTIDVQGLKGKKGAKKVVGAVNQQLKSAVGRNFTIVSGKKAKSADAVVKGKAFYAGKKLILAAKIEFKKGNEVISINVKADKGKPIAPTALKLSKQVSSALNKKLK